MHVSSILLHAYVLLQGMYVVLRNARRYESERSYRSGGAQVMAMRRFKDFNQTPIHCRDADTADTADTLPA